MNRILSAIVLVALLVAGGSELSAQEATDEKRPLFVKKVEMPLRGDGFQLPSSVVADLHAREVFVCDPFNHRIAIFDDTGLFKFEILGGVTFRAPRDVAVDPEGYLFAVAFHKGLSSIVKLDFDGKFLEVLELQGLAEDLQRLDLRSVAISPSGDRLYTMDIRNHRLFIFDRSGVLMGAFNFEEGRTEEEIESLVIGRVDVYDTTVIAAVPSDGLVYLFDLDGQEQGFVGLKGTTPCHLGFPVAGALDEQGRIVILDKQRALFQVWDPKENRCIREYFGFGNRPGFFYQPDDLTLDRRGQVFVSQGFEGRVQMYKDAEPAAFPAGLQVD